MRLSTRSSVDLPQPDGPMKAVTLFAIERHADVFQRAMVAVEEIEVADRDLFGQTAVRSTAIDCASAAGVAKATCS